MSARESHRLRRPRGGALIEFAMVVALALALVFGIVDFGRGFGLKHQAAALSRAAANLASRGATLGEAVNTTVSAANPLDLSRQGAVVLSRLEKRSADSGFVITEQRQVGVHGSRLGKLGGSVAIPDAGSYPAGSALFAGEVFINFEPVTPFESLEGLVLPGELYQAAVFYGAGKVTAAAGPPERRNPPPGPSTPPGSAATGSSSAASDRAA
ncbi:MAG TPA: TadE/TadG family type IV pilus assembly protein [Gemmatimonadota bacterium]